MVGIALDISDLRLLALRQIPLRIHDDAATYGTICTGVARFGRSFEFPGANGGRISSLNIAEAERTKRCACEACGGALHKAAQ